MSWVGLHEEVEAMFATLVVPDFSEKKNRAKRECMEREPPSLTVRWDGMVGLSKPTLEEAHERYVNMGKASQKSPRLHVLTAADMKKSIEARIKFSDEEVLAKIKEGWTNTKIRRTLGVDARRSKRIRKEVNECSKA